MNRAPSSLSVVPGPQPSDREIDIDIFNTDHPRSVFNLLPTHMQEAVKKIPKEFFEMSEHELELRLKPDPVTCRIRIAFWLEYDHAQANMRPMRMPNVYSGACHKVYFSQVICKDDERLAWILCPPADYMLAMRELLQLGVKQLRKIVNGNIVDEDGNIDTKAGELLVKVMQLADLKVHGSEIIRHKMETKAVHVHTHIPAPAPNQEPEGETIADIDKKIREAKRNLELGSGDLAPPGVIDVSPVDET